MHNVLMINSSLRKKNTDSVLSQIGKILIDGGMKTELIHLSDYRIGSCTGCQNCVSNGPCHLNDDVPVLMEKIRGADAIVLGSPVYVDNVSGSLKTLADRTYKWYHIPEAAGKQILFVTTTSATGLKNIKKSFEAIAISWGGSMTDFISRTSRDLMKPIDMKELSQFISLLQKGKQAYKPSFYEINIFQVKKVLALHSNGQDKTFWTANGLFDEDYYFKCKIGFVKKAFSKMIFSLLSKAI